METKRFAIVNFMNIYVINKELFKICLNITHDPFQFMFKANLDLCNGKVYCIRWKFANYCAIYILVGRIIQVDNIKLDYQDSRYYYIIINGLNSTQYRSVKL